MALRDCQFLAYVIIRPNLDIYALSLIVNTL